MQRCLGEVLAGEGDVKKGERWYLAGERWELGAACARCRGTWVKCLPVKEM